LVYDPSNRESFTRLEDWASDIRKNSGDACPIVVLRNKVAVSFLNHLVTQSLKVDLASEQDAKWVAFTEATEWCNQRVCPVFIILHPSSTIYLILISTFQHFKHFGVSAKTGVDIKEAMECAATEALAKYVAEPPISISSVVLHKQCETHQCCCTIIGAPPEHFKK